MSLTIQELHPKHPDVESGPYPIATRFSVSQPTVLNINNHTFASSSSLTRRSVIDLATPAATLNTVKNKQKWDKYQFTFN